MSRRSNVRAFRIIPGRRTTGSSMNTKRKNATWLPERSAEASFAASAIKANRADERTMSTSGWRADTGASSRKGGGGGRAVETGDGHGQTRTHRDEHVLAGP